MMIQIPDVETAFQFRRDMYKFMGMELPERPAKKVLFWLRPDPHGRSILNIDEVTALVDSYNIPYTYVPEVVFSVFTISVEPCLRRVCCLGVALNQLVLLIHCFIMNDYLDQLWVRVG